MNITVNNALKKLQNLWVTLKYVSITERLSDNYEVSSPKYNEICSIINKLKSNKGTGLDYLPPQLIKNGG
jgi:hypothetical protein